MLPAWKLLKMNKQQQQRKVRTFTSGEDICTKRPGVADTGWISRRQMGSAATFSYRGAGFLLDNNLNLVEMDIPRPPVWTQQFTVGGLRDSTGCKSGADGFSGGQDLTQGILLQCGRVTPNGDCDAAAMGLSQGEQQFCCDAEASSSVGEVLIFPDRPQLRAGDNQPGEGSKREESIMTGPVLRFVGLFHLLQQ